VKSFPTEPKSAVGSMNHVAFHLDEEELEGSIAKLRAAGVKVSVPVVVNHDDSRTGAAREVHEGVWVRSVYFRDPNGIMLELAAVLRDFRPDDVAHAPARAVEPAGA
jgi:catechol 2,3-dioxygenase-like lactoylglutathione lyase family enzyme